MNVELNLKTISSIMAIISIFVGLFESTSALRLLAVFNGNTIFGFLAVILSVLGIGGIYLANKDLRLSALQYLICGIGVFICIYLYGVIVAILFIIAAVIALISYYHDNERETVKNNTLKLIPVITIVIIALFIVLSAIGGNITAAENAKAINITDVNSDIKYEYGYYSGNIKGNLHVNKDFNYLIVKINYYNKDNVSISDSIGFINNDVKSGVYKIDGSYFNEDQPVRAELKVYNQAGSDAKPIYTYIINL